MSGPERAEHELTESVHDLLSELQHRTAHMDAAKDVHADLRALALGLKPQVLTIPNAPAYALMLVDVVEGLVGLADKLYAYIETLVQPKPDEPLPAPSVPVPDVDTASLG